MFKLRPAFVRCFPEDEHGALIVSLAPNFHSGGFSLDSRTSKRLLATTSFAFTGAELHNLNNTGACAEPTRRRSEPRRPQHVRGGAQQPSACMVSVENAEPSITDPNLVIDE